MASPSASSLFIVRNDCHTCVLLWECNEVSGDVGKAEKLGGLRGRKTESRIRK